MQLTEVKGNEVVEAVVKLCNELLNMKEPHKNLGVLSSSRIAVVLLGLPVQVFGEVVAKLDAVPEHTTRLDEVELAHGVWLTSRRGTDSSILGLNVVACAMDAQLCGSNIERMVKRRMESRFDQRGSFPCMVVAS